MFKDFGSSAVRLSRSPLGIIALSFVLVYGISALVSISSNFQENERFIIIWFLVLFPLVVLGVFYNLVTRHHTKLYAPSDFSNEDNFIRLVDKKMDEKFAFLQVELGNLIKENIEVGMRAIDLEAENSVLKLKDEFMKKIEQGK